MSITVRKLSCRLPPGTRDRPLRDARRRRRHDHAVGAPPLRLASASPARTTAPRRASPGTPTATPTDTVRPKPSRSLRAQLPPDVLGRRGARRVDRDHELVGPDPEGLAPGGISSRSSPAAARRTSSPAAWPRTPLTAPSPSTSSITTARALGQRRQRRVQAGQRVARDPLAQLGDHRRQAQPVGGLQREQLEQLDVLGRRDGGSRGRRPRSGRGARRRRSSGSTISEPTPARRRTSWPTKPRPAVSPTV